MDRAPARATIGIDVADERLAYLPESPGILVVNPTDNDWFAPAETATQNRLADVVFEVTGNPGRLTDEFEILRSRADW